MYLLLGFAFIAGIATVLSPCILPVLPAILSASASGGKRRPFGVILGLLISFIFFTLALTTLVRSFGLSANLLRDCAIFIIGFFGIILIFPSLSDKFAALTSPIANLGSDLQSRSKNKNSGFLSGLVIGLALGLVWTPCAGPILAAITTLVAVQEISFQVVLLTFAYSLGAVFPLLIIAYGGQRALNFPSLAKHAEKIRQGFGVLMLLTALALGLNWDAAFQQSLLEYFPSVKVENAPWVQKQLEQLRTPSEFKLKQELVQKKGNDGQNQELPLIAPAPPLVGITAWINSPPLSIKELKGKVVLIDFWTYSCINCIRTFPYLRKWYENYKDKNFVIIGVHTPEFEFEKNEDNVKKAVERFHLTYPIALDNQYATWRAYDNSYWPAHYLIDQDGIVREVHYGEGGYVETENAIRSLLHLSPLADKEEKPKTPSFEEMTRETYLGYERGESYASGIDLRKNEKAPYVTAGDLKPNKVGLQGSWTVDSEYIVSEGDDSELLLNFKANRVYLVLGGQSAIPIQIELDGKPLPSSNWTADMDTHGEIAIKEARKYDIVDLKGEGEKSYHLLKLHVPKGIRVYAFTFGMEA